MSTIYLSAYDRLVNTKDIIGTSVRKKWELDGLYYLHVGWQVDLVLTPRWWTFGKPRKVKMKKSYITSVESVEELEGFISNIIHHEQTAPVPN